MGVLEELGRAGLHHYAVDVICWVLLCLVQSHLVCTDEEVLGVGGGQNWISSLAREDHCGGVATGIFLARRILCLQVASVDRIELAVTRAHALVVISVGDFGCL